MTIPYYTTYDKNYSVSARDLYKKLFDNMQNIVFQGQA